MTKEFKYKKLNEEESTRNVLVLTNTKEYIDTIDLDLIETKDKEVLFKHMEEHEKFMKPYVEKGFRRFLKDRMKPLNEGEK